MLETLDKDTVETQDEALVELYRRVRPGEPPTVEAGTALLDNFYFNSKRYDLAKVGRYKINKKLGVDGPLEESTLTLADVVATVKYLAALHKGEEEFAGKHRGADLTLPDENDDNEHYGNRRIRAEGDIIQNQA